MVLSTGRTDRDEPARRELIVVQRWFEELRRLVPTN